MNVRLRLLWYPQAQFIGPLMAQHSDIASKYDFQLECQPIDFDEDPISAVLNGNAELCVASPSHMFDSGHADKLIFLLTLQQESPVLFLARKDQGISDIHSLSGHRIAVWPGNEHLELLWMLKKSGMSLDEVEFISTADTVSPLLEGKVSCTQVTTFNEYFDFLNRGGDPDSVVHLAPSDFGADLIKGGIIARRDWIEENRDLAERVISSLLHGWTRSLENQEEALKLCLQLRPDLSEEHHLHQLREVRKLAISGATRDRGLGYPDIKHIERAAQAMEEIFGHSATCQLEDYVSDELWMAASEDLRRTDWQ